MSESAAPIETPPPTSEPAALRLSVLPPDAHGRDPLVHDYLTRFRPVCAYHTISWSWVGLGALAAVVGAWIGNRIAGPFRVAPLTSDPLVLGLHQHFGNPWGVIAGIAGAAAILATVATLRRRDASTAQEVWAAALAVATLWLLSFDQLVCASVITGVLCVVYLAAIAFRLAALALGGGRGLRSPAPPEPAGGWPMYTVLVPLYRERNVARNILRSLEKIDYPRDRLDVKFLLEADDPETLEALKTAGVPDFAEILVVPPGQPKTKPRACNHGLARARGDWLVIFDAEDRPDPDQLKQAVWAFAQVDARTACLQAQLAYHNYAQNLLTRWFALEYNLWFGRYLSGLERLGAPIPLGGTSNHFRTALLRELGGWDPFNVTEDCDLGVRLARAGYRTRMLDSVTWEEANSRLGNWLRQRSRWLKGYLVTHLVWSRRPLHLIRALGPWATLGFLSSVFCVSALAAVNLILWLATGAAVALLAVDVARGYDLWLLLTTRPVVYGSDRWSWPLLYPGAGEDPLWSTLALIFAAVSACLFLGNFLLVAATMAYGRRPGQTGLWFAALISPLYWVLISLAAWKAVWQLIVKPHYWEKTVHGLDEGAGSA